MRPEQYVYIAAWGYRLGSHAYYIKAEQEKAAEDNAPADALYRRDDGTWVCRSALPPHRAGLQQDLDRYVASRGVEE